MREEQVLWGGGAGTWGRGRYMGEGQVHGGRGRYIGGGAGTCGW